MSNTLEGRMLEAMVIEILKNPVGHKWTLQGLGMMRLSLPMNKRLHVWDSRYAWVKDARVHTHPWDLTSLIVAGEVTDQTYTAHKKGPSGEPPNFAAQDIVCGQDGCAVGESKTVALYGQTVKTYYPGDVYNHNRHVIHSTNAMDGSVTIIERFNDSGKATVFYQETWDQAHDPARVFPTVQELRASCDLALDLIYARQTAVKKAASDALIAQVCGSSYPSVPTRRAR